ncbi:MAG TPA: type II CRISPR RNA-guided endonuclease Cas9, partial [Candidatus Hodarchaeales archaeon]|nr:type II CRISPR RNA-guided endonuclease Cas9 [Candidatus Hodarchaeales archaeon]
KEKDPKETPGTVEFTKAAMQEKDAKTFGELIAIEYENRTTSTNNNRLRHKRVRNRADVFGEKISEYVADRHMILAEFEKLWETQRSFAGPLAAQLTDDCREELYNKKKTNTWRCQGVLFSQRKAYWDLGTLGRCDLEPTDMKCSRADMYAQEFLVLTSVNNIRITPRTEPTRKLTREEREKVMSAIRRQKTVSESTIRKALGIDKGANKTHYTLNTEGDKFTVNGDWFYSQIACDVFGEDAWKDFDINTRESVNRAILKFDPGEDADVKKLTSGCKEWWKLDEGQTGNFIAAWQKRPKTDSRVNLSRKAIKNLLPYLRDGWSVTEARDMYAEDASHDADDPTRSRYSTKEVVVSKRIRHFQEKHADSPPPVSEGISNPVVRKSIHEVRRHLTEYIKKYGKPDRVGIELAREARQSERVVARRIQKNKAIDALREEIIETHKLDAPGTTSTQRESAVKRVRLCRQQREMCAYSGETITDKAAAEGSGLEIDHIVPRSRGGDNGMSNLVLCYASANQGKGTRTPIDWLSKEDFGQLELRFKHLHLDKSKKGKRIITKDTVDMVDNAKWENLHRETPKEGFTEEQLRSGAYAATQTSDWINKVLYGSEDRSKRYVFASGGQYTGILRRDWGLFFDEDGQRSEKGAKNRGDHRHHAVDAAIIAVTAQCLAKVKEAFIDFEEQKEDKRIKPVRDAVDEPWDGFSEQLAEEYMKLKVSHRAYNRQIAGHLHKDTLYGPAVIYERYKKDDKKKGIRKGEIAPDEEGNPKFQKGLYIKNIGASDLRGTHLRMPIRWSDWKQELKKAENRHEKKKIWEKMYALDAVAPGKSGIVRDVSLRRQIRDWLIENGIENIDNIKKVNGRKTNELITFETLVKEKGLIINGTPVRKVRLLWKLNEVKEVRRKGFDYENSSPQAKRKSLRVYQTQNNHHIEIREKATEKGEVKWSGDVVTNFDAAERIRRNNEPIIDKSENEKGKFVMSLSKGEIVHMRYSETQEANYFVVFKIDKAIHFTPHTDANPASSRKDVKLREEIQLVPNDLRKAIVFTEGGVPEKVKIPPLGEVEVLVND